MSKIGFKINLLAIRAFIVKPCMDFSEIAQLGLPYIIQMAKERKTAMLSRLLVAVAVVVICISNRPP